MLAEIGLSAVKSCSSTMSAIKELQAFSNRSIVALVAEAQTEGRGQYGRVWSSPQGNIYCSVAFQSDLCPNVLIMAASVVIRRALGNFCDVSIKWPNDLFVQNQKVGGMLLERAANRWILGFGINALYAPIDRAVSLASVTGVVLDKWGIIKKVLADWQIYLGNPYCCCAEWNAHGLWIGRSVKVERVNWPTEAGKFLGVSVNGSALLDKDGQTCELAAGSLVLEAGITL